MVSGGQCKNVVCAEDIDLDRIYRDINDLLHAYHGCKVEDAVNLPHQRFKKWIVEDGPRCEVNSRVAFEACKILHAAGRQVVNDKHLIAALNQGLTQMAANETGAASH